MYQFDIAAAIVIVMLLLLTMMRRGYPTLQHKIFIGLMVGMFIVSIADCVSVFTISFPQSCPVWFNYLINIIYSLALIGTSIVFVCYVLITVRGSGGGKKSWVFLTIILTVLLAESAVVITTPFTHAAFYFDGDLVYCRGVLYYAFYAALGFLVLAMLVFLLRMRRDVSASVMVVFTMCLLGEIASACLMFVFPRVHINCFVSSMMMVVIYVVIENPLRDLYKSTKCYNQHAFVVFINDQKSIPKLRSVIAFKIENYRYMQSAMGEEAAEEYFLHIFNFLAKWFKREQIFCMRPGVCAVIVDREKEQSALDILRGDGRKRFVFRGLYSDIAHAICVVRVPDILSSPEEVLRLVDVELQDAESGEVVIADGDTLLRFDWRQKIAHAMRRSVENLSLEVYYQPIWNCATKRFDYAEALVRIKDDELGFVSLDGAIPLAEQSGLVIELGYCVLSTVCRDFVNADLKELGVKMVSINLSMVQCAQPGFAESALSTVEAYGLHPSQIGFEITETAAMGEQEIVLENISAMAGRGFLFSLNDFGTGFSNMSNLIKFPASAVKIDKSILWQAMRDNYGKMVLMRLVESIKGMDKHVVVEGVESEEMVEYLDTLICDCYQGYYYSEPLSRHDYLAFLHERADIDIPAYALEGE